MTRRLVLVLALGCLLGGAVSAQPTTLSLTDLACLPHNANQAIGAKLVPDLPGATVRLYFRRLHNEVEDFYWSEMRPAGDGTYWGVFPVPTDDRPVRKDLKKDVPPQTDPRSLWAAWWRKKDSLDSRDPNDDLNKQVIKERAQTGKLEKRAWIQAQSDQDLQRWLERQELEPAEYFAAVFDAKGQLVAKSDLRAVPVQKQCAVNLSPQQASYAANLTVGETALWQKGERPFHWQCSGIVTRIGPNGMYRSDDFCRVCAIAWWHKGVLPVAAAVGTIVVVSIDRTPHKPVSPSQP